MDAISDVVRRLWALCNILRDDGITYQDYLSELTYLLFLKLVDEVGADEHVPSSFRWSTLEKLPPNEVLARYRDALATLGKTNDHRVATIFADSGTKIRDSRNLSRLMHAVADINWYRTDRDSLGTIYEGLIEKNAGESRYGAGQYFTPRPLVEALVAVSSPHPSDTVYDPASGTAGFLTTAGQMCRAKHGAQPRLMGRELVRDVQRMAQMNLWLHDLDGKIELGDTLSAGLPEQSVSTCLTNPPFGVKGKLSQAQQDALDFPTSNKQLAFIQHVYSSLTSGGIAAVVVPDNVLFEFGVASAVRSRILDSFDLHTVLRLPPGIFYATGVRTSVLFFASTENPTEETWFYDLRAGNGTTGFTKRRQLQPSDLSGFTAAFGRDRLGHADRREDSNFRRLSRDELRRAGDRLDFNANEPDQFVGGTNSPSELIDVVVGELEQALTAARALVTLMQDEDSENDR